MFENFPTRDIKYMIKAKKNTFVIKKYLSPDPGIKNLGHCGSILLIIGFANANVIIRIGNGDKISKYLFFLNKANTKTTI
ncbi:hypothetical protein, partial [Citrobacter freundii]|uniref:hypothetical protein n=1 Tax=Citrobacter freundii TaxID=546 RepID=UPI003A96DC81